MESGIDLYRAKQKELNDKKAQLAAVQLEVDSLEIKIKNAEQQIEALTRKREDLQEELDTYFYEELEWLKHYKHPMKVHDVAGFCCFLAEILTKARFQIHFPIDLARTASENVPWFVLRMKEPQGKPENYYISVCRFSGWIP